MNTTTGVNQAARAEQLRAGWIEVHGSFSEHARQLLEQDPGYSERVLDSLLMPGGTVPPARIKALILLAVDRLARTSGVQERPRTSVARWRSAPARQRCWRRFELTSTMGIHAAEHRRTHPARGAGGGRPAA